MGNTRLSIRMDYQRAIQQAEKLEAQAQELNSVIREAENSRLYVRSGWSGDSVNEYIAKLDNNIDRIRNTRNYLQSIAKTVRNIAKRTYDTEMQSLEISLNRTYH